MCSLLEAVMEESAAATRLLIYSPKTGPAIWESNSPCEAESKNREVWIYGEQLKDVTTHPAFRKPARMCGARRRPTTTSSRTQPEVFE